MNHHQDYESVMVPNQRTVMNSSCCYDYRENIHLGMSFPQPRWAVFDSGADLAECWFVDSPFPPASGGHPHQVFTPYRGLGLLPGAWGAPNKRNAEGIFGNAGRVWAAALRPDPL